MKLKQQIIDAINQYGASCELQISETKTIKFKGVIYQPKNNFYISQNDFLHTDPFEPSISTLIVADPIVLNHLTPGLIIKTKNSEYQILKTKKFMLSDNLYYMSSTLSAN
ncbi:MAG: hypothetical protein J6C55_01850 [Oscillospiraceae bacterium]|nr:hypothetical protein [Oscillospiraceae bacterium]